MYSRSVGPCWLGPCWLGPCWLQCTFAYSAVLLCQTCFCCGARALSKAQHGNPPHLCLRRYYIPPVFPFRRYTHVGDRYAVKRGLGTNKQKGNLHSFFFKAPIPLDVSYTLWSVYTMQLAHVYILTPDTFTIVLHVDPVEFRVLHTQFSRVSCALGM